MAKTQNYTDEEKEQAINLYKELGNAGLDEIANRLNKTTNSVRAKLVREGVYEAPEKQDKQRKNGPSKKEIIRNFEDFGLSEEALNGLQGATKKALNEVQEYIQKLRNDD